MAAPEGVLRGTRYAVADRRGAADGRLGLYAALRVAVDAPIGHPPGFSAPGTGDAPRSLEIELLRRSAPAPKYYCSGGVQGSVGGLPEPEPWIRVLSQKFESLGRQLLGLELPDDYSIAVV